MEGSVDRISGLPEAILALILSFILTEDAVRTAATCKRLNQVWTTLPFLDLGTDFFPDLPPHKEEEEDSEAEEVQGQEEEEDSEAEVHGQEEDENKGGSEEEVQGGDDEDDEEEEDGNYEEERSRILRKREKLFTFLDQTLMRRRMQGLTIQKFHLAHTKMDVEFRQYLDRWIHYLVECNIKDLVFIISLNERQCYDLPGILLTASSLFALTLKNCRMPSGANTLSSLRKLHLEYVYLHDQFVKDIISTCRDLEELKLIICPGLKNTIDVSGQSQLMRVLELSLHPERAVDEVVVEAQYLEKFSYTGGTSPVKINIIINLKGCLTYLQLLGANITNEWFCQLISKLPCLEELILGQLNLKAIEISSSSLKRLTLFRVFEYEVYETQVYGEFTVNTPNLIYFNYMGCLRPVFLTSLVAKEVVLDIDEVKMICTPEQLCSKLMQILHIFDHSEVITLNCSYFEQLIFPLEMRSNLVAPMAHIKHLILKGRFQAHPIQVVPVLFESLRWICPNMRKLSFKRNHFKMEGYPIDLLIPIPIELTWEGGTYAEVLRCVSDLYCHFQDQ